MIDYVDVDEIELTPKVLRAKRAAQRRYELIVQNAAREHKRGNIPQDAYAAVKSEALQTYYESGIGKWLRDPPTPEERKEARITSCLHTINRIRVSEDLSPMTVDEFKRSILSGGTQ